MRGFFSKIYKHCDFILYVSSFRVNLVKNKEIGRPSEIHVFLYPLKETHYLNVSTSGSRQGGYVTLLSLGDNGG